MRSVGWRASLLSVIAIVGTTGVALGQVSPSPAAAPASPAISPLVAPSPAGSPRVPSGAFDPAQVLGGGTPDLVIVSCASQTFCVTVDSGEQAYAYDGTAWGKPVRIDDLGSPNAISCPNAEFCMVTDLQGHFMTWNGKRWSKPVTFDPGGTGNLDSSCSSPVFCAAVNTDGIAFTWNGKKWSKGTLIDKAAKDAVDKVNAGKGYDLINLWVDCPADGTCIAVDSAGSFMLLSAGGWSAPAPVDPSATHKLDGVSCAAVATCVAGAEGSYLTWDGTAWTNRALDPSQSSHLAPFDCPAATFCMAVPGYWYVYDGMTWLFSGYDAIRPGQTNAVDCPDPTLCVAVGPYGSVSIYHG